MRTFDRACMDHPRVVEAVECDHLHETTTRYDHEARRLDFFLFCPVCRAAKLVLGLDYEPRFEPMRATVHALPSREHVRPQRQAA